MLQVMGLVELNIKMLIKDKIAFLWSISLPSILLFLNQDYISKVIDLRFWWAYIIISAYIFGIGVYSLKLRENGNLKTMFSISKSPMHFFIGNLLTQIIYISICLIIFNFIATLIIGTNYFFSLLYSLAFIIICIPVAFVGFWLTIIKNFHVNSLNTIANIVLFLMFILLGSESQYNKYNPIYFISNVFINNNLFLLYCVVSIFIILITIPIIKKYSAVSHEIR